MFCCGAVTVLIAMATAGVGDAAVFRNAQQGELLSAANAKFALDLYRRHTSPADKNIFMSPLSISVALAMTYQGARNQTASQMREVLHFADVEDQHLHQTFADILSALNDTGRAHVTLYMANRLFGDKSKEFLDQFLQAALDYYGAALQPVDFRADNGEAEAIINQWVAEKTNKKVPKIVTDLSADTALVLVNAIYFKGDWLHKFNATNTKDEDFHVSPSKAVNVEMMHMKSEKFNVGRNYELHCQAIELPYAGGNVSMFILLPDRAETNLSELEKNLTYEDLLSVKERFRMYPQDVNLWLPRFSMDQKLKLNKALSGMGMPDLFRERTADLSGIDGSKNLYVSQVLHRAVVEVNEEGTEAAASTGVGVLTSLQLPRDFRANHPFLFFIQDKPTKSVLFLGRLVNPSAVVVTTTPTSDGNTTTPFITSDGNTAKNLGLSLYFSSCWLLYYISVVTVNF